VHPCRGGAGLIAAATPVSVVIGDPHNAEPGAVVCGTCSAEIDDRVTARVAAHGRAEPEL
jgi:hypothetical protein